MKPAAILFFVLTGLSLWFSAQDAAPVVCRGKPLPIALLPGPKMTGPEVPLRFGGTRPVPRYPINSFPSDTPFRLVIRNRDEFNDFWARFTAPIHPSNGIPPPPEVDFSKEMVVVAAMGQKPTSGYWTIIDGACEMDGKIEVFVSNVDTTMCMGQFPALTYPADAVRLPQTDLPVVFRKTEVPCKEWLKLLVSLK
jgi:hypothetical protein